MSSLETRVAVVRGILSARRDPPAEPHRRQPESPDAQMMYAWSIGTTRAAQPGAARPASVPATPESEPCPPEVYIG
jgi:hypothetical protein